METVASAAQESDRMRTYKLKLEKYGISKAAYEELRAFCLQYDEKLARLNDAYSLKSPNLSGMPHGGNISDPTARAGEIAIKYREDIELIESTAKEIDDFLAPFLLLNVTKEYMPPWLLISKYNMPATEQTFNLKRRKFYYLLALKKNII